MRLSNTFSLLVLCTSILPPNEYFHIKNLISFVLSPFWAYSGEMLRSMVPSGNLYLSHVVAERKLVPISLGMSGFVLDITNFLFREIRTPRVKEANIPDQMTWLLPCNSTLGFRYFILSPTYNVGENFNFFYVLLPEKTKVQLHNYMYVCL